MSRWLSVAILGTLTLLIACEGLISPTATPASEQTTEVVTSTGDEAIEATTGTPVPIPTFTVVFAERLQPGTIAGPPPESIPYAFRIMGFNLQLLTKEQWKRLCECPPSSSRGASPEYDFIVYMNPETPSGTYSVMLTLPDGRRAETTFVHTTTPTSGTTPPSTWTLPSASSAI